LDDSTITKESVNNNGNGLKPSAEKKEDDGRTSYGNLINEGILAGQKIAKLSVITLLSIGVAELLMGHISGSVVAIADGIDSLSDAMISFIVLLGLRIAQRPADKTFHFGYHKVESFAALMAAIGMVIIGFVILYHSYEVLIHPREIQQPILTMIVLASAAAISLHRAFQMRKIANRYDILSLKTDAKNSIKDGSASVIGFFSVFAASQFGFLQADAIGGMIIAGYIFSVSYVSLKRSSLILVDSWQNPKATDIIRRSIEEKFGQESIRVRSVLLRPTGMVAQAEVHVEVDGSKPLTDVELLSLKIEMEIRSKISTIERVSVIPHSFRKISYSSSSSFIKSPVSKKLSNGIFFNNKK
jgi:cation diffusion facilitator family transporter